MTELRAVIGLEVHAQINTKTKLFCACDNDAFGKPPNSTVCPICMGHPGTLPMLNKIAVDKAIKAAVALGCEIISNNHFDRKNYFYPDLPMGFQISQYHYPISKNGKIEFSLPDGSRKKCRIARLHMENDAGKLQHAGGRSYCDFNRAGTPLMEIVTEPDLEGAMDAVTFAKELQRILVAMDASDADMYKGMMRFDASISLCPKGESKLYPRSEIKNLNSFKSLEKALLFEQRRLAKLWEAGTPQNGEVTVHWDSDKEIGTVLRQKESSADYRYFPEPDIPPLHFERSKIKMARNNLGEMPEKRKARYMEAGLPESQAILLIGDMHLAGLFDKVAAYTKDYKRTGSVVITQLMGFLRNTGVKLPDGPDADQIIDLLKLVDSGEINSNVAKIVLEEMVRSGDGAEAIIKRGGMQQAPDVIELEKLAKESIQKNQKATQDFCAGNRKAKAVLVGYVMGKTRGQADPVIVNEIIDRLVESR